MSDAEARLKITADAGDAQKGVDDLAGDIDRLAGKLGGELGAQAQAAAAKLRELGSQEAAVKAFLDLQKQVNASQRELVQLTREADNYAAQIAATGQPTANEVAQLDRLRASAASASGALGQQKVQLAAAAADMRRHGVATDGARQALTRIQGELRNTARGVSQLDPSLKQVAQGWRGIGDAAEKGAQRASQAAGTMRKGISAVGTAAHRMAIQLAAAFTFKEFVNAAQDMDKLRAGLKNVSGDSAKAAKDMEFLRGVATRAGADISVIGQSFLGLAEATKGTALAGEPTRQVFEAVASAMGKAGKSGEDTAQAIDILTKIANKGTVTVKDLRNQLGDALPGALDSAAKGLGVTTGELMEMVSNGQVLASDLFPALAKGLNDVYGGAPQAKTLGQELSNVKNAFVDMASHIGENGGMEALKTGAQIAEAAITLLGVVIVGTGKKIGALVAAIASMDFSQLKATFADIESEAQDKLLKTAKHNGVLRSTIEAVGDQSLKTKLAQQEQAAAIERAGKAAEGASPSYVALAAAYKKAHEQLTDYLDLATQNVTAAKARGDALVAEAKLQGDMVKLRQAEGDAAAGEAAALNDLALVRKAELAVLETEKKEKKALLDQNGDQSEARKKELADLDQLIAKKKIEADTVRAQAAAAADNARAKGKEAQAKAAELDAARASTVAVVAEAKARLSLLETQKNLSRQSEEMWRLMGNEEMARLERINQLEIEIKITRAKAEVARAEAEGSIAVAQATLAEMAAKGKIDPVKEAELNASIKLAQAKLKEADAIKESAKLAEMGVENMRNFGNEAGRAADQTERATGRMAKGFDDVAGSADNARQSVERLGEGVEKVGASQYKNKEGWASDASGKALSFGMNEQMFNQYIKRTFGEEFIGNQTAMKAASLKMQLDYWASIGVHTSPDGSLADIQQDFERLKRELDKQKEQARKARNEQQQQQKPASQTAYEERAPSRSSAGAAMSAMGSGATYVSNITVGGRTTQIRLADQDSQQGVEALLRTLARDKGVAVQ